jgi:hypothetical protein
MVHEEPSYVVRKADGTTLSFPAWMTDPASANAKIGDDVQLSFIALLELRRLITNALSSLHSNGNEGGHDEATSDTAAHAIRRPSPDFTATTSGEGKICGKTITDRMDASAGKGFRSGGEK